MRLSECEDAERFSRSLAELYPDLAKEARQIGIQQTSEPKRSEIPPPGLRQEAGIGVVALASSKTLAPEEPKYLPPIDFEQKRLEATSSRQRQVTQRQLHEDFQRQKERAQQEMQRVRLQVERERVALERERQELQAAKEAEAVDRQRQREKEERQREKENEEEKQRHPERVGRSTRIAGIVIGSIGLAGGLVGALYAVSGMPQLDASMQSAPATPGQERTQMIGWSIVGAGAGVAALGGLLLIIGRSMQQNAIMRANQRRGMFAKIVPLLGPISGMALSVEY